MFISALTSIEPFIKKDSIDEATFSQYLLANVNESL